MDIYIAELIEEVDEWTKYNFPHTKPYQPLLGIIEEVGELSHAHLKHEQDIREDKLELYNKKVDAVGDIVIYLTHYCLMNHINLHEAITETWKVVGQRDWKKNRKNGNVTPLKR